MAWFRHNCSYTEQHEPEHTYTFTGKCVVTGEDYSVTVKGPDLFRYNHGEKIQDAFPYLPAEDREFLMTGTSPKGWDEMWGFDEDDEDDEDIPLVAEHFNVIYRTSDQEKPLDVQVYSVDAFDDEHAEELCTAHVPNVTEIVWVDNHKDPAESIRTWSAVMHGSV